MSESSESILDHIAEMLHSSPTHNRAGLRLIRAITMCHLANIFRLGPNDYELLLVFAGLAHYSRFGFAMKPTAWSKFLGVGVTKT